MNKDLMLAVVANKALEHCFTSADARLYNKTSERQFIYQKQLEQQRKDDYVRGQADAKKIASDNKFHDEIQRDKDRKHEENIASQERYHQREMQVAEHLMREKELDVQREAMETQRYIEEIKARNAFLIAERDREAQILNAERDRDVQVRMHAETLSRNEQLELRKMRVQENIAKQASELQEYLYNQGIKDKREIERFKALATRETQILVARENARNALNDKMVQQALDDFPLNISPIVLLRKKHDSLTGLLRFSSNLSDESWLPAVSTVYNDVIEYSEHPEPLTIFIAPLHISQEVESRMTINEKMWDSIYQKIESLYIQYYNRNGKNPAIIYPTAWKKDTSSGQHASETLHFFLEDIPCVTLEPIFDGHSLKIMMSSWGIGYLSSNHSREELNFPLNLDLMMIECAYERSLKSMSLLSSISELSTALIKKKEECEHNIRYYRLLDIDNRARNNDFDDIEALGSYRLFNIDPVKDIKKAVELISDMTALNLAIITDAHHLIATDTSPILPLILKNRFPTLYENIQLRQLIFNCYEKVYLYLRHQESHSSSSENRRELERVRELQITNLQKQLGFLSDEEITDLLSEKLRKYVQERFGISSDNTPELWDIALEKMDISDVPFFKELLPNIDDRRLYKKIDKRLSELQ